MSVSGFFSLVGPMELTGSSGFDVRAVAMIVSSTHQIPRVLEVTHYPDYERRLKKEGRYGTISHVQNVVLA